MKNIKEFSGKLFGISSDSTTFVASIKNNTVMKKFNIEYNGGDTVTVETTSAREAARIARRTGRDLMKDNNHSSLYWVWDEEEENLLYMVSTFKSGNRTVTTITNCTKNK